jgi:electron transport complex protein RnfA
MSEFGLLVGLIFANNLLLDHMLGIDPAVAASRKFEVATGLALVCLFLFPLIAVVSYFLHAWVLQPLGLGHLNLITVVFAIAGIVMVAERLLLERRPLLWQTYGVFLPILTVNSGVVGIAVLAFAHVQTLFGAFCLGIGAGLGYGLVLVLFAGLRERIDASDVPEAFAGIPIALITLGIMSLGFLGFQGVLGAAGFSGSYG